MPKFKPPEFVYKKGQEVWVTENGRTWAGVVTGMHTLADATGFNPTTRQRIVRYLLRYHVEYLWLGKFKRTTSFVEADVRPRTPESAA